jgi:hypothetical protein
MCTTSWSDFLPNKIAAILPCNDACCIKCLLTHCRTNNNESIKKQDRNFRCPLCNLSLTKSIFQSVALAFVSRNLCDSFRLYNEILNFSQKRFDMLIVDFLLKHDFNLDKVEDSLWNLASLIDQREFLSSWEKQKMYEEARAPVLALKVEIHDVKTQIKSTKDKSISHS